MTATLELPPVPASVPQARRFVVRLLEQWSLDHLAETAALLTSEVVSNALLHARTEIFVAARPLAGAVEVSVRDGSRVTPVRRRPGTGATPGRGVELLEQLAQSWEVVLDAHGKTVTFTVDGRSDPWAAFRDGTWEDAEA